MFADNGDTAPEFAHMLQMLCCNRMDQTTTTQQQQQLQIISQQIFSCITTKPKVGSSKKNYQNPLVDPSSHFCCLEKQMWQIFHALQQNPKVGPPKKNYQKQLVDPSSRFCCLEKQMWRKYKERIFELTHCWTHQWHGNHHFLWPFPKEEVGAWVGALLGDSSPLQSSISFGIVEYELVNCMYAYPPTLWGRQVKLLC